MVEGGWWGLAELVGRIARVAAGVSVILALPWPRPLLPVVGGVAAAPHGQHKGLDLAFVFAPHDAEVAVLAPGVAPRVGAELCTDGAMIRRYRFCAISIALD